MNAPARKVLQTTLAVVLLIAAGLLTGVIKVDVELPPTVSRTPQ
jgi:hypothetical protein